MSIQEPTPTTSEVTERPAYLTQHTAFYYCRQLDCGLFYKHPRQNRRPILEFTPFVPRLNKQVSISLVGIGQEGYNKLVARNLADRIFPVDLWHTPNVIDPFESRTTTSEMVRQWECVCGEHMAETRHES